MLYWNTLKYNTHITMNAYVCSCSTPSFSSPANSSPANSAIPFTHLTYMLLLHYVGKQVKCIMITFNPINQSYTLQLYSLKQHPVYLYNQSKFKFNYYSNCSKCSPFSFTQAWSTCIFGHSSIASSTVLWYTNYSMCLSSAVSDRSRLELASDTHDLESCPIFDSQQD